MSHEVARDFTFRVRRLHQKTEIGREIGRAAAASPSSDDRRPPPPECRSGHARRARARAQSTGSQTVDRARASESLCVCAWPRPLTCARVPARVRVEC
eukprot:1014662-Pleurochrysis_carterae.AAC.2